MTPSDVSDVIVAALRAAVVAGELALPADQIPESVVVERPKAQGHGDFATNIAMRLAKSAGVSPRDFAGILARRLSEAEGIEGVEVAGPGFVNITLETAAQGELARTIVSAAGSYGRSVVLHGQAINLEFISANPTGPLHLGHTRWAALGDAIGRILDACGAAVTREFYINDRGIQMDHFGASLAAVADGKPVPDDGYKGTYVVDLAAEIVAEHPEFLSLPESDRVEVFREAGYQRQLRHQREVLDMFRTHFDVWYSERTLHASGAVERGMAKLREQGHVYDQDGAVWLRTSDFGDDKDRVLVKADGELTYFASDIAYYLDKRARGFDVNIYLLGADHHGYVNRLRTVAAAAGDDPDKNIEVLIGQLVKMVKGGEEVRLSKRAGNIITLEDVVDEVGIDAARYTLCRYPADSSLTIDLDLLVKRTNDNPVFYVQYAHARIASLLRNAHDLGMTVDLAAFRPELLTNEMESDLLGALSEFPRVVASAAELREPHRVARYLEELATAYHKFYDACRVLPRGDEEISGLMLSRVVLCAATHQVLANGLEMLGVSAPERM